MRDYFENLELPDHPTIYDHLVLSLREKDVITTFNWDPFLIQAARRNRPLLKVAPRLLFLHDNVAKGFCHQDKNHGPQGMICPDCGNRMQDSHLLYPISEKNYDADPAIASNWNDARIGLQNAFMLTIFGYGAPVSDKSAVDLLLKGWGGWASRELEQIEFIDIRPEAELLESWSDFVHTHHFNVEDDFYSSSIAEHPRRTGEAWLNRFLHAKFVTPNPVPYSLGFRELWEWYGPLLEAEQRKPQ